MLDFGLVQRARLAEIVAGIRLEYHRTAVAYDDVAFDSRPLIQALSERLYQGLVGAGLSPERSGLLLLASGDGDSSGRAQSHQLMRLVFDQLGFARGEVAFLRHARPLLEEQLDRCVREALGWLIVPQMIWRSEPFDDARRRVDSFYASRPEAQRWKLMLPVGHSDAPVDPDLVGFNLSAWLEERIMVLWRSRRQKFEAKRPSPSHGDAPRISCLRGPAATLPLSDLPGRTQDGLWYGDGCIAEVYDREALAGLLGTVMGSEPVERIFIKVTWHGYAPGTYTDPVALDRLLAALPAPAVLVEGHTSSRNLGGSSWDWRTQSQQHRGWIAEQDAEYLRRTGIEEVIHKHKAQYVNVTEAFWDGQCAPREQIEALLAEAGVELSVPRAGRLHPGHLPRQPRCALPQLRPLQGSSESQPHQSVRSHSDSVAHGLARAHRRALRPRVLRPRAHLPLCVPGLRYGRGAQRRREVEPEGPLPEPMGQLRPRLESRHRHAESQPGHGRCAGKPAAGSAGGRRTSSSRRSATRSALPRRRGASRSRRTWSSV